MSLSVRATFIILAWIVLLAGPLAWSASLSLMFPLTGTVCRASTIGPMLIVGGGSFVLACAAGIVARAAIAQVKGTEASSERNRFMLGLAVWSNAIFALVIAAMIVPVFLLSPCRF